MFFQLTCDTLSGATNPLRHTKAVLRRLKVSRCDIVYIEEEMIQEPDPDGWPIGEYKYTTTIFPLVKSNIPVMRGAINQDGSAIFVEVAQFEVPADEAATHMSDQLGDKRRWGSGKY